MLFLIMEKVINGLIFEKDKVLVVKKKDKYILPGGELNFKEFYFHCLEREFREKLSGTHVDVGNFYDSFSGITPFSKKSFETNVYFCELIGKLGKPSAEILDRKYIGKCDLKLNNFSEVTKKILEQLVEEGYLK